MRPVTIWAKKFHSINWTTKQTQHEYLLLTYIRMYIRTYVHMCVCVYVCMYTYVRTYVFYVHFLYACIHVYNLRWSCVRARAWSRCERRFFHGTWSKVNQLTGVLLLITRVKNRKFYQKISGKPKISSPDLFFGKVPFFKNPSN